MINFIANYEIEGTNKSTLSELKKWLLKNKTRAVDSETGISEWVEEQTPIMYQIGDKWNQWIIDRRDVSIESLKSLLQDPKSTNIIHNAKFDYKILKHHENITLEKVWDTMICEQILNTGLDKPKGFYTLESTHLRYYNNNPYDNQLSLFDPFVTKQTRNEISRKTTEPLSIGDVYYGSLDVITAYKVYEKQKKEIESNELLATADLENEFVLVLGDMELNGMPIDSNEWLRLSEWSGIKMQQQLDILRKMYPEITNWNSHVQVKKLFKELGIPIKYQQKESISELVIKEYKDSYPIIGEFLLYKKYQKLNSTYGVKFLDHVNPHTGRIHASFMQIMNTGRISCQAPNLTNLPQTKEDFLEAKQWREAFRTTNTFTIADFSQQELRVVASISKDEEMLQIFREGRDPHKETAAALYNVPLNLVTPEQRKVAKTFGFAILYGASPFKVAKTFSIPIKEAKTLVQNYYNRFVGIKDFQDASFEHVLRTGYILADINGRRSYVADQRYLPYLKDLDKDPDVKKALDTSLGDIFRRSSNYPIQGTAALIAKRAGILMRNYLKTNPNEFKIVLLEHDCWIVENLSRNSRLVVEDCMRRAAEQYCSIEIPAEGLVTEKWSK